jgi:transcriptional regulator with XRE-family HTH domain
MKIIKQKDYKLIRKQANKTQLELASFIGLSVRHYQRIENGEMIPTKALENLLNIVFNKLEHDYKKKLTQFNKES